MTTQFETARQRLGGRRRARPGSPHVLGVIAGRGGAGVSLFAAALAMRSARMGRATLLVDADPWLDTQRVWLGLPRRVVPSEARLRADGPEALVMPVLGDLELASMGWGDPELRDRRALLRRVPSMFERRAVVIVDAGSRLEGLERCLDLRVGSLLVVTDSDAIALASTHALLKAMRMWSELEAGVAFNRVQSVEASAGAAVLREGAERYLDFTPAIVGHVPTDAGVRDRLCGGATLPESLMGSELPDSIGAFMPALRPWSPS